MQQLNNVWRDANLLVLTGSSVLPRRCLRCNGSENVALKKLAIEHFPKYNLALWLVGVLISTRFTLKLPLCRKHRWHRTILIGLGIAMIFAGIGLVVAGIGYNLAILIDVGIVSIIAGLVVAAVKGDPISVKKFDKPYLWLKGIDKDYLAALPRWREREFLK